MGTETKAETETRYLGETVERVTKADGTTVDVKCYAYLVEGAKRFSLTERAARMAVADAQNRARARAERGRR